MHINNFRKGVIKRDNYCSLSQILWRNMTVQGLCILSNDKYILHLTMDTQKRNYIPP